MGTIFPLRTLPSRKLDIPSVLRACASATAVATFFCTAALAADLEDRIREPSDPEDHQGTSIDLDGRVVEPGDGEERQPPKVSAPGVGAATEDPEVAAARERLRKAQARAETLDHRYADMRRTNYPRGEERAELIREREAALVALVRAEEHLREVSRDTD
jgi:hypothetical protein